MPKKKVIMKKNAKYSMEDLIEAVENVRQKKMNSYEASVKYEIPRSTIIHRLYGTRGAKQSRPGRPPELSLTWETKVASCLHMMEKYGYPLTPKEVKLLISNYIKRNGIVTQFKDDYPGKEWFRGFKRRHKLSIKKPQSVEVARKKACNPFTVYNYFDLLEKATQELGLTDKPQNIYNLDETSFCSDPTKTKAVGLMGFPSTRTTGSPGRNNTSVLLATNALGEKIPPLIIFQGKHLWTEWLYKNEKVNTAYSVSHKGWMETSIFEQYLKSVFFPAIGAERPVLLVYDGHSTHVDISVVELLVAEEITVLKLPAHSSHILQPLDCSTMKPMKDKWDSELVKWQRLHVGEKLPKREFSRIITKIWDDLNPAIIQNGLRKTGIYPVNRDIIPKEKFDHLSLSRWEDHLRQQNEHEEKLKEDTQNDNRQKEKTNTLNEETLKESYTQKENRQKEKKIPTLVSVCLKIINCEVQRLPDANNPAIVRNLTVTKDMNDKNILTEKKNDSKPLINTSEKKDLPKRKGTQSSIHKWETVKDPKTFILSCPKTDIPNTNNDSCKVEILSNIAVNLNENRNNEEERVSFEELLLKSISRNDIPKTSRKRISQGAEILTYKDSLQRLRKEKEEKEKAKETKRLSKKATNNNKNNQQLKKRQKNKTKANKIKRRKSFESDSESNCSYTSINSSEDENLDAYLQSVLEKSTDDENFQELSPSTPREQKEMLPKIKSERVNERQKNPEPSTFRGKEEKKPKRTRRKENERQDKLFRQNEMAVNLPEKSTLSDESVDEESQEPLPSICRKQEEKKLKSKTERIKERKKYTDMNKFLSQKKNFVPLASKEEKAINVGDFILAKFQSTKGKKTYKYVCLVEDINQEKIVVKGLKSKKDNREFKFIKNDLSIIEKEDVISYLPKAVLNEQKDTVTFPCKVEVVEYK